VLVVASADPSPTLTLGALVAARPSLTAGDCAASEQRRQAPEPRRYDQTVELLERDAELENMEATLQRAAQGRGSIILVSGEAGIGKSRLVDEFLRRVKDRAITCWAACDDLVTPTALGPFRELARLIGGAPAQAAAIPGISQGELFPLLLEALSAARRPMLLVVEDAHWADAASLDGLKYLGRRIGRIGAVLVITYRDDEVGAQHPLRFVLGEFPTDVVLRIPLGPLSPAAVARLAGLAGYSVNEVQAACRGNPFLLTEFLSSGEGRVPASVVDSISARLAHCSPQARALLEIAAVVPGRCERAVLTALLPETEGPLEEAREHGLLDYDLAAAWFRHDLARRAAEHLLSPQRRRDLHRALLSVLVPGGADPARIVHHAEEAADVEALIRFAPLAARQARAAAAHREAVDHYRRLVPHLDRFTAAERADLLAEYTVECYLTDDQPAALDAAERALELRRSLRDADGEGEMLRWLSRLHWWLADPAKAAHAAGAAREVLEPLGPSAGLAMAYSNLAQLHMLAQEQELAVTWATKAIATARKVGDMPALTHALNNLGSARLRVGDLQGRTLLEESLALARREGLDEHAARAFSNLSWTALDYREYERAASYLEVGLALAADRGLEGYVSYLTAQRARLHLDRGEWDQAEADARWVLARPEAPGITSLPALTVLARVRSRRGAPDAAKLLEQVWDAARLTGELQRIAPVAVARAEFAWLRDDRAGILAAIRPALALTAARQRQPWVGDEIAFWLWRAGEVPELRRVAAVPFARHMCGDWRGAAEAWARLGCPFEQACALADGDTEAELGALELYDRLGAAPASALVRRRLRAAGSRHIPRGPRPKTRSNAAGLTPRQAEVAQLLVEGLGNPEIAARLFLSPRTVEHHVSAVLVKLGAADRDEAARNARRLGLGPSPT
jgi:DNA-binding CsgD family transcriptional regulator